MRTQEGRQSHNLQLARDYWNSLIATHSEFCLPRATSLKLGIPVTSYRHTVIQEWAKRRNSYGEMQSTLIRVNLEDHWKTHPPLSIEEQLQLLRVDDNTLNQNQIPGQIEMPR